VGGYIGGRSIEKISGQVFGAVEAKGQKSWGIRNFSTASAFFNDKRVGQDGNF
jgi:hypothetical protein